jgi:hypothetical protein
MGLASRRWRRSSCCGWCRRGPTHKARSPNTHTQLETKTWAAIQKWHKLCITEPWFVCTSGRLYHHANKQTWFCTPQTCREENSEALAGQHAATSTSFYLFDEASAVLDKIFEAAEGGLTDGHPFILLYGNPTRSSGKLYRVCFGNESQDSKWVHKSIDSRDCRMPNQELIAEWIETYGVDSDFVRLRVRGLPPAHPGITIGENRIESSMTTSRFTGRVRDVVKIVRTARAVTKPWTRELGCIRVRRPWIC